ncbi:MAG: hypothetical protein WD425_02555, partial [Nitrospirales bacterium]
VRTVGSFWRNTSPGRTLRWPQSIKQAATDLGIHANVFSRWCQEQQREGTKTFRGKSVHLMYNWLG